MPNLVERTTLSAFTLRNMPVAKGQIVNLDPDQLVSLAGAGCVALTDEVNARVPVADLPVLQPAPSGAEALEITARLDELRASAREEAARLERALADARAKAADDITGIERSTTERLEALGREVREAEVARDARLREIGAEVEKVEAAAKERVSAAEAEADKAVEEAGKRAGNRRGGQT